MSILRADEVHMHYDDLHVLRGVTFEVGPGEVKVIIGPSGSGKSTLLRCLAMLETPDVGDVYLEAERLTALTEKALARDGMTMVVVSHELRFAHHVASSVLMMDDGRIVEEAPPDEFFSAPKEERTKRFLSLVE